MLNERLQACAGGKNFHACGGFFERLFSPHCSVIEASVAVRDNNSLMVARLLDGLMKCNTIDGDSGAKVGSY